MAGNDRPGDEHDASRREFFRTFGRETVRQASAVVGAAAELRRSGLAAAQELMDPRPRPAVVAEPIPEQAGPDWTFRSPYRVTDDAVVAVDQRELPGRVATVTLHEPSEVASAMRSGVINGGPVLGQVAAYAIAIAARSAAGRPQASHQQLMRAALGTLRAARRDARTLGWAVERMEARYDGLVDRDDEPPAIADALRAEADAVTSASIEAMSVIGRAAARHVVPGGDGPANLLMHGDMGPMSCGMVGMGTALIQALADAGHGVHVWLTEASPSGEGSRIAALQLTQLDIAHTVVPDSAVGWLFHHRRLDAAVLRGDRIAANGDAGVLVGGAAIARIAESAGVPVLVLAPSAATDPEAEDGRALEADLRSAAESLAAARDDTGSEAARPAVFGVRLNPTVDVVPAGLIGRLVTETAD